MKSFISVILSLIYFSLSTGAMVNMHYCGGELESIKINSEPLTCCCGDMETSNNCCQNEELILKLDIDQQISSFTKIVPENLFLFIHISYEIDLLQELDIEEANLRNYNNPSPKLEPLWLVNCTFTYYG